MNAKELEFYRFLALDAKEMFLVIDSVALEYGNFRGGAAVGFVDSESYIWSVSSETNPDLPSRWGRPDNRYACYAELKLQTALSQKSDTKQLPNEELPFKAVHEGAIVFFLEQFGVWVGIAYSGHKSSEDKEVSSFARDKIFFSNERE